MLYAVILGYEDNGAWTSEVEYCATMADVEKAIQEVHALPSAQRPKEVDIAFILSDSIPANLAKLIDDITNQ